MKPMLLKAPFSGNLKCWRYRDSCVEAMQRLEIARLEASGCIGIDAAAADALRTKDDVEDELDAAWLAYQEALRGNAAGRPNAP